MSRYAYDYSLTPARPTGWRSVLANAVTITTIVAVSAISGAVVTLDLFASPQATAETASISTASAAQPVAVRATRVVAARFPQEMNQEAHTDVSQQAITVSANQEPAAAAVQPVPPPETVMAPQPAPAAVANNEAVSAPANDLTFATGYAQRHAAQDAVVKVAVTKIAVNKVAKVVKVARPTAAADVQVAQIGSEVQVGRPASKIKPKVAKANTTQDARRTAVADANAPFAGFDRANQFDFAGHQALAFGDPRVNRRASSPPSGGSGTSTGGLFGGLF